ncbi:hypothetical protein DFH07DRAFT_949914 [Mycena maculata]|uniref:Uncharacterized protein n=1 Tax=Mycena maculata TaxID=230809 RepID=A0AAD7NYS6_9AGAR|nr:hypothetical protein DFH07DRAFT_949914 [Mycena maculata]
MTNGPLPLTVFSQEDVKSLQEIIQQYIDGGIKRNNVITSLSTGISSVCSLQKNWRVPVIEAGNGSSPNSEGDGGDQPDNGDDDGEGGDYGDHNDGDNEPPRPPKRSLSDRLSDSDDEDGSLRSKRCKVDNSSFVRQARTREFLNSMVFSPKHQNFLQQVEIYSCNLKGAVNDLSNTFNAPALPESQWKNVLLDRFVDFDSILTSSYSVELEEPQ